MKWALPGPRSGTDIIKPTIMHRESTLYLAQERSLCNRTCLSKVAEKIFLSAQDRVSWTFPCCFAGLWRRRRTTKEVNSNRRQSKLKEEWGRVPEEGIVILGQLLLTTSEVHHRRSKQRTQQVRAHNKPLSPPQTNEKQCTVKQCSV